MASMETRAILRAESCTHTRNKLNLAHEEIFNEEMEREASYGQSTVQRTKTHTCIETAAAKTVMAMPANNRLSKNYTN